MSDFEDTSGNLEQEKPLNGRYQITLNEEGVHLVVYPPKNQGTPVKEEDILADLAKRKVTEFDGGIISQAVNDATGKSVKIGKMELAEPEIDVRVDRERMEAELTIVIHPNCRAINLSEAMDKINACGVTHGIDEVAVKQAIEHPGKTMTIANGNRPENGQNASIKYFVNLENKGRPLELEDGRVDFKDLNLFTVVNEGDLLAEKNAATHGTDGIDVLGQSISAKSGKDISLPAGKNTKAEEDKLYAVISGQVQFINNKINVLPVIEIKEDVDLSTGNITFVGNVVIRGSVQAGFKVVADGNVDVYGSVSGGTIEAKNIVIRGGIQGMQRGEVSARENLTAKFIENGLVSAGQDIIVADAILHSRANAGKRVIVEGKRGIIAGGHVMAADEIRAKVVGTHLAVATELEVGVPPEIRDEYQILRKELKEAEHNLDQAQKALIILKNMNQVEMPPEKREMMLKMTKAQFQLAGAVDNMRKRRMEIELVFDETRYGRIRVSDMVYPGVKIVIGNSIKLIRETCKFTSFYVEDGDIKTGTYK
ncbi:MAG: Flagellar Assembly Protein [Firmicutes bacterium]|nr:Flagellar Assembly Protein [Bacillota bacterium]